MVHTMSSINSSTIFEQLKTEMKERQLAEKQLADKTILLENVLRNAIDMAIVTTDLDFRITYYNSMAEHLLGYAASKVIDRTVQETHLQNFVSSDRFETAIEAVHQKGEFCFLLEQKTEEGVRYIESRVTGIYSPENELTGYSFFASDITTQKKLQNEIIQSKNEWQQIFDSVSELIALVDKDYNVIQVNRALAERLKLEPRQCIGKLCYELLLGISQPLDPCPHVLTLADAQMHCIDLYEKKLGGWFSVSTSPLFSVDGDVYGTVMVATDINEQKAHEKELQQLNDDLERRVAEQTDVILQREQMLQSIFRAAPTGIGVVRNTVLTRLNPMVEEITGYAAEELLGQSSKILYCNDAECQSVGEDNCRQIQKYGSGTVETKMQRKDGRIIDVLISSTPTDNEDIEAGVTFTMLDITKRKKVEQELSTAYGELDQIFNAAVPLSLVSAECCITRVNQAFCDYFHVSAEEIIGRKGADFWGCDFLDSDECALKQLDKGGNSFQRQFDGHINGDKFFCTIHSVPHFDTSGCFIGLINTFFDMSETKKAQGELIESQKQLRHAEKLSAIGTLSGSIAHEFNNPLCGVINVLDRIDRKTAADDKDKVLLHMAQTECERMKKMIQDLQHFNRPSSGSKSDFDPHKSIENLLSFFKKEFQEKKATIIRQYMASPVILNAVHDQIRQVLLNLIKNAVDALAKEGGIITITTQQRDQHFIVSVHDSGEGISTENMKHIFEPFFTTKSAIKGTGLGLSVSHGIIESHNGTIHVESEPGKGTTFTVRLPLKTSDSPVQEQM